MKSDRALTVGVGLCALDYINILEKYPASGEKIDVLAADIQGGGPVPTALCTIAKLGGRTSFIGKCGNDDEGKKIVDGLKNFGVETDRMVISSGERSAKAFIWVDKRNGQRTVVLDRTGITDLKPEEIDGQLISSCNYLLIDGRETEAALKAAAIASANGAQVVLDAGSNRSRLNDILAITDHLVGSESFARALFSDMAPSEAAVELYKKGKHKAVVITMGERGVFGVSREGQYTQHAFNVEVVDTTGAGDVFHGAYIYALSQGYDLRHRLQFASAAAALKCRHAGGRAGIPTVEEINRFLDTTR